MTRKTRVWSEKFFAWVDVSYCYSWSELKMVNPDLHLYCSRLNVPSFETTNSIMLRDLDANNKTYPQETSSVQCTHNSPKLQQIKSANKTGHLKVSDHTISTRRYRSCKTEPVTYCGHRKSSCIFSRIRKQDGSVSLRRQTGYLLSWVVVYSARNRYADPIRGCMTETATEIQ